MPLFEFGDESSLLEKLRAHPELNCFQIKDTICELAAKRFNGQSLNGMGIVFGVQLLLRDLENGFDPITNQKLIIPKQLHQIDWPRINVSLLNALRGCSERILNSQ